MEISTTRLDLPSPAPGTRRFLTVHRFGAAEDGPKAFLQAALHADEPPGLLVLEHLIPMLEEAARAGAIPGQVIVVPVANPIGLAQQISGHLLGRFDLHGSGNFNRDFPMLADRVRPLVEGRLGDDPERNVALVRDALRRVSAELPRADEIGALKHTLLSLSVDADVVLDLHCDWEGLVHIYANRRHETLGGELGAELGAAAILLEDDPGGMPFDSANSALWWTLQDLLDGSPVLPPACFAATVELRGEAQVRDDLARQDAAALFRFLQRRGVLAGDCGALPATMPPICDLEAVDVPKAPHAGLLVYHRELGETIKRGEVLAEVIRLDGGSLRAERTPVVSATDGIFLTRLHMRVVRPGQPLAKVAGGRRLEHRQAGSLLSM